ncbi:MAG: hypothetical protein AAF206_31380, partial [Bacteroidota bacterium]
MRIFAVLLVLIPLSLCAQDHDSTQQKGWLGRTVEQIFGEKRDPAKPHFLVYPTLAYAPETNLEIGVSALALFYAKNDYQNNRLSEINLFSFITTQSQYGIWLDHAI